MFEILNSHQIPNDLAQQSKEALKKFMGRSDIGFVALPDRKNLWEDSQKMGEALRKKFDSLVIVGLGGSSLGGRVLAQVAGAKNVFFADNVDAVEFENLFENVGDLKKTCWLFISKSGTTIETLLALEFADQYYKEKSIHFHPNCVVITENKKNTLSDWAKKYGVPQLEVPLDVGGRFSVLSPVGLVPAAFMGFNLEKMRQAAGDARKNGALIESLMAHFMMSFHDEQWITLFWYYNSRAHSLGMWIQQLWAESLGKKTNRQGAEAPRASTPMWAIGAVDQHSVLQQVMEGTKDKFVLFHRFDDAEGGKGRLQEPQFTETANLRNKTMGALLQAEAIATEQALRANGVPTLCLRTKVLDEGTLAYYFMMFELIIAGMGEWMNINAFDQPGVELGKRLAKDLLNKA
jgi:glucose-6-phosphate isomerase